jgi:hypothetical protein
VSLDERGLAKFLRGLTIGALIGAVIAGSRIWRPMGGHPARKLEGSVNPEGPPGPERVTSAQVHRDRERGFVAVAFLRDG